MFKQLRTELTILCTAITGIILVTMACASLLIAERQLGQRSQEAFASDFNSIVNHLSSQTILDFAWISQTEANGGLILQIEDNGRPLAYGSGYGDEKRVEVTERVKEEAVKIYGFEPDLPPATRLTPEKLLFPMSDSLHREYYTGVAKIPASRGWLTIVVVKSKQNDLLEIHNLRWMFAGLVVAGVGCLGVFAWFFTARSIRPVAESRQRQAEFISAASHELRSPLAVIRTSISAMQNAAPPQAEHFATVITDECMRMSRLVDDMLSLANADSGRWSMHLEECDMETLLLDTAERFEPQAGRRKIHIVVDLPEETLPLWICDRQRIGQVLGILLDNAVSYSKEGGRIHLSASLLGIMLQIRVADNGPGIPDSHKPFIFNRFYRGDASRSQKEHYGLGLCIAQEIVQLHHGAIEVLDTQGGGATFLLRLPNREKPREQPAGSTPVERQST